MRQVYQEDEAENQEQHGTDQSDIVAPEHEEAVRDEEGKDNQTEPGYDLGPPESILNTGTRILRGSYAHQESSENEVEESEGEVDPMYGEPSVTLSGWTVNLDIIQHEML